MIKYIKSLFAWKVQFRAGAYSYFENTITGERTATKIHYGYSPLDTDWLNRTTTVISPPHGGSGVSK